MEKCSDMYDCFILANKLRNEKVGKKMKFTSSIYQGILEGEYHFYPYDIYNTYSEYRKDALNFCINKEEEVAKYQSDKAFNDEHIDELIIINNEQASEENKDWFENTIHLPIYFYQ